MTIADYCAAFQRKEILINETYQRSPDIWPLPARSYLIETILKGFPVPKLALHQITDLKSRRTIKYVVDGQQRSSVILSFFSGQLRLSRSLELASAANRTYDELSSELQEAFLSYVLYFDQFETESEEPVREYFRRINSFTAPLNPEEHRHARYQGAMKWFIYGLTERYGEALVNLGVLAKRSVIRMADAKFLAEIVHGMLYGIVTTSKSKLDSMYKNNDYAGELQDEESLRAAIDDALEQVLLLPKLRSTSLIRSHIFYSLLLAIIGVRQQWATLKDIVVQGTVPGAISPAAQDSLLRLAAAFDDPDSYLDYKEFTDAAAERTNVKSQREKRIHWLSRALTQASM